MGNTSLKTKAFNLTFLKKYLKESKIVIPSFFSFSKKEFKSNSKLYVKKICYLNKKEPIILRSSSITEDGKNFTNAGKYDSLVLKKKTSQAKIENQLKIFVRQFKSPQDEIIIQVFVDNVGLSGVLFTKDSNTDAPYYSINFDYSGKTNLVTSGKRSEKHNQFIFYKKSNIKNKFTDLIDICKKLEKKTKNDRLDIEFCIKNKKLYLFQIRYLPKIKKNKYQYSYNHDETLVNIEKKLSKLLSANPTLPGKKSIFSNMADWNPAEIIGEKPNTLALSLYKELISDDIWRVQRKNYGYSDVFPNILIFSFGGMPFVDLRTDINSFLPKDLKKKTKEIVVNKYLSYLSKNIVLHDKIEFELVETCYSLNTTKRLNYFFNKKVSKEYSGCLRKITKDIFHNKLLYKDILKIKEYSKKIKNIASKKKNYIQEIFFINEITKEFGTLPFAGIARCAFISERIFLDLKENNLISNKEYGDFFSSFESVTTEIKKDYKKYLSKKITKASFLNKYGHLRPQTYDINSLNYREAFETYFNKNIHSSNKQKKTILKFNKKKEINNLLLRTLNIDFVEFVKFAQESIYWREKSKFYFTIGIDKILCNLIKLGKSIKIKRSDLSHLDIKNILNYFSKLENAKLIQSLKEEIIRNKKEASILEKVKLPDIILSKNDIYSYYESKSKINFITDRSISGEVVKINDFKKNKKYFNNKIVIIENADPGYDFIFNYNIKGLITKYGGSNSHMAIRCLENQVPACIGVGAIYFDQLIESKNVYIDCNNKIMKIL